MHCQKRLPHRWRKSIRRTLNNNKVDEVEYPLDLPSGRHWFLARVSPIFSPDGSSKTVSILVRDITERKQAEEALKASRIQVSQHF